MVIDARLKSIFILPAVGVLVLLLLVSLVQAFLSEHERIAWLGAAVATLPLPLIFTWLTVSPPVRTSENLPALLAVSAAGVVLSVWEQFIEGASGWWPTSVALAGLAIFALYIFWYSRFGRISSSELAVGATLPDFELKDTDGNLFRSTDLAGTPGILLFYRGNWCPLCMAQIREIAGRYQDLDAMGIDVVLISPQPDEQSRQLAATYDVPFRFLVDQDNEVARLLKIAVSNGVPAGIPGAYSPDTVMPTLVVTNAKRTIVFSDQTDNYRVRPEPDVFLAILRRTGATRE